MENEHPYRQYGMETSHNIDKVLEFHLNVSRTSNNINRNITSFFSYLISV